MNARTSRPRTATSARGSGERRGRRPWLFVLGTAAALQGGIGVAADVEYLGRIPVNVERFWGEPPAGTPFNPEASAARTFPVIVRDVPRQARVLVVSTVLVRVPYEFWLLPRPFAMLLWFPAGIIDEVARTQPRLALAAAHRRRILAQRGQIWDERALAEQLARADYVITFGCDLPPPHRDRLRPRRHLEQTALYAVER